MKRSATIPSMFFAQADRYGERTALLEKKGDSYRPTSWRDFEQAVREVACGLISLGVEPGDRVAIMSYNRPEWAVADLAIMAAGAVTVPVYHTSSTARTNFILDKTKAKFAFVARSEKAEMLATCGAPVNRIIALDPEGVDSPGACAFDYSGLRALGADGLQDKAGRELEKRLAAIKPEDCATIIFTSGTTGDPKGVMLSHRNILANAAAGIAAQPVTDEDIFLSFLPLSHSFERTVGQFVMLMAGATIAYAASLRTVADNIMEVRPTIMLGVPRFFEKLYAGIMEKVEQGPAIRRMLFHRAITVGRRCRLLREAGREPGLFLRWRLSLANRLVFGKLKNRLGGRLRFFVSGGAPLVQAIGEFFLDAGIQVLEGYGLTENSPITSVNRLGRVRPGTVGPLLPGVEVKIADDGEILVRGPSVMLGYYEDRAATEEVIRDGWLHTGDLGALEDGFLRVVDRKKEIIVTSNGKKIPPQRVENLILTDPWISQVMLYGDRRKYITALVVPDYEIFAQRPPIPELPPHLSPEELAGKKEVYDFLLARIDERTRDLPAYERVRKIFVLPEPFSEETGELTPTMKVRRRQVTQKFRKELNALYEE